jgi:hypothetical protein
MYVHIQSSYSDDDNGQIVQCLGAMRLKQQTAEVMIDRSSRAMRTSFVWWSLSGRTLHAGRGSEAGFFLRRLMCGDLTLTGEGGSWCLQTLVTSLSL